jgi:hypothetical protein
VDRRIRGPSRASILHPVDHSDVIDARQDEGGAKPSKMGAPLPQEQDGRDESDEPLEDMRPDWVTARVPRARAPARSRPL